MTTRSINGFLAPATGVGALLIGVDRDRMSTRSQLRFQYQTDVDHPAIAQVYRHSDGYPESVLPALHRLQALLRATGTERGPADTAAEFIHLEKCRGMGLYLDRGPGREIAAETPTDVLDPRNWVDVDQPLFLLGYGVEDPTRGIHGDEEYLYVVELPEFDSGSPDDTPDWIVRVSEHWGFPRWDGPTEDAFEEARWAYEGPLADAMAGLEIEPA